MSLIYTSQLYVVQEYWDQGYADGEWNDRAEGTSAGWTNIDEHSDSWVDMTENTSGWADV